VEGQSVVSWQACQEDEYSWIGRTVSGIWRGIYALYLCHAFRVMPASSRAAIQVEVHAAVNGLVSSQHPVLRGNATELAQLPFA
jgi:hypothetical protein